MASSSNTQNSNGHVGGVNIASDHTYHPYRLLKDHIIDIIKTMVPIVTLKCCIYRVPKSLRVVHEAAYTPRMISIGPYHRQQDELRFMENHKVRFLKRFLDSRDVDLYTLITNIKGQEEDIRQCYAESFHLISDEEFVTMVLFDGAFVIRYILESMDSNLRDENDGFLYTRKVKRDIVHDFLLLKNQLPFHVLKLLHGLAYTRANPDSFLKASCLLFAEFNKQDKEPSCLEIEPLHFTDLVRTFHLPASLDPIASTSIPWIRTDLIIKLYLIAPPVLILALYILLEPHGKVLSRSSHRFLESFLSGALLGVLVLLCILGLLFILIRVVSTLLLWLGRRRRTGEQLLDSALGLYMAGIHFVASSSNCMFDIKLKETKGLLMICQADPVPPYIEIPSFAMTSEMESLLINMIALEQYRYQDETLVSDYIMLLNSLINSAEDVGLLVNIVKWSSNHAALATLIENMGKGIVHNKDNSYFRNVNQVLARYSAARCGFVILYQKILPKFPWGFVSAFIAVYALAYTIVATKR